MYVLNGITKRFSLGGTAKIYEIMTRYATDRYQNNDKIDWISTKTNLHDFFLIHKEVSLLQRVTHLIFLFVLFFCKWWISSEPSPYAYVPKNGGIIALCFCYNQKKKNKKRFSLKYRRWIDRIAHVKNTFVTAFYTTNYTWYCMA